MVRVDELVLMHQKALDTWGDPGAFATWAEERYGLHLPGEYQVVVEPNLPMGVRSILLDPDMPEGGWRLVR